MELGEPLDRLPAVNREGPAMARRSTLGIIQTASPDYRLPLWSQLASASPSHPHVFAGRDYFAPTVNTPEAATGTVVELRNRYLLKRRLLVQRLPLPKMLRYKVVVAEGNPRILSTWFLLMLRRVRRRPTLLWGHVLSRRQRDGVSRRLMRRLADGQICYTRTEAAYLSERGYEGIIVAAPNAVARSVEIRARDTQAATNFVYVGRMVPAKRPELLLQAFLHAAPALSDHCRLAMVGDGPLLTELRRLAETADHGARVDFLGHISDPHALAHIYDGALAAVSPGYVGLSIVQAHSFGVPMVVADEIGRAHV